MHFSVRHRIVLLPNIRVAVLAVHSPIDAPSVCHVDGDGRLVT